MDEAAFKEKLGELLVEIHKFPQLEEKKVSRVMGPTVHNDQLRRSLASLQDSLDYLRVTVKYLAFDLEATKRENRMLRSILESDDV